MTNYVSQGPGGHVSREEYLLGRKIDKALEQLERAEAAEEAQEGDQPPPQQSKSSYTIEHGWYYLSLLTLLETTAYYPRKLIQDLKIKKSR